MDNSIEHQLAQWKQKYYQSLEEIEKQQTLHNVLKRSLSRLTLVAQGQDDTLDQQLSTLRSNLKAKDESQSKLESILEQIEQTIVKMENNPTKQSTGDIIAELLTNLPLNNPLKKQAKSLAKTCQSSNDGDIKTLLPELNGFFSNCLEQGEKAASSPFSFNLFGKKETDPVAAEQTEQQPAATITSDNATDNHHEHDNELAPHLLLLKLLERLSLPPALTERTTSLHRQLETGIDEAALPAVIDEIADIISALGSQSLAEKKEYETFLKSLSARLNELDQQIHLSTDEGNKAFQRRSKLGEAVEQQVQDMLTDVERADDLEWLKNNVNERLDFLNQHLASYREADQSQFSQSQQQIQLLKQRIKLMEQESIELRQSAMRSRDLALKDALTGIWNRQALNETLDKEFTRWQRYKKPLSVIMWDVDFFKRINDKYGHAAGDKVLKTIAQIFNAQTRDADFIARYGGEEFMGVFPETSLENALGLANKIREKIHRSKFHYEDETVTITASAGLAAFEEGDTIDSVFQRADQALYKAKNNGRNQCISA